MDKNYLFTSESVTEGHPDKVCDMISDGILDEILSFDKDARVACETLVTKARVVISAEITTTASINYKNIVMQTLKNIGYSKEDLGINNLEGDDFIEVLIKEGQKYGKILVGLISDKAIAQNKRVPLLNYNQRKTIIENINGVSKVVTQMNYDYSENIKKYKPNIVASVIKAVTPSIAKAVPNVSPINLEK